MSFFRSCLALSLVGAMGAGAAVAQVRTPGPSATVTATTEITVQHAKGSASVAPQPQRIAVFDLSALDTLHALGVPVAGAPSFAMPAFLKSFEAPGVAKIGSLFQPDYEALARLQPDLILVGGRSAAKYEVLSKIAPTLDMSVGGQTMLADMRRNTETLAALYGKQAQGQALMAKLQSEVDSLRQQASQAQPGLLLMAINEKIMPQAPGSRFGLLFDVLGAPSALTAKDLPARGTAYSFDDVAKLNPAWIYVIDRNTATGQAAGGGDIIPSEKVFANAQVQATTAGQKGQVVFLDPKGWYLMGSAGPTAMLQNIAQLKKAYAAAAVR